MVESLLLVFSVDTWVPAIDWGKRIFFAHCSPVCKGGFASKFAVTILTVVAVFKIMGLLNQIQALEPM